MSTNNVEPTSEQPQVARKPLSKKRKIIHISFLVASIAITILFLVYLQGRLKHLTETYENYGYLGIFLMGLIGSSAPIWPLPGYVAAFIAGGLGWNPFLIALAAGVGEATGEWVGYIGGFGTQIAVEKLSFYSRIKDWMRRRGSIVIFLASAIPNHFIKAVGAAAGALHYPAWKYYTLTLSGKYVKSLVAALIGGLLFPYFEPLLDGEYSLWIILAAGVGVAVIAGSIVYLIYYRKKEAINRNSTPTDEL
jgi:membrane protein DedA with SNARE-associated domain